MNVKAWHLLGIELLQRLYSHREERSIGPANGSYFPPLTLEIDPSHCVEKHLVVFYLGEYNLYHGLPKK